MDYPGDLMEGRFKARLNRFLALVEVDGREVEVHVANSGRMHELFTPERRVLIRPRQGTHRKTAFDLALVDLGNSLASADARLPNLLVAEALALGKLPQFSGYTCVRREVTFGESRLDLLLEGPPGLCYLETKSVTLVTEGVALFPDAPTSRGVKHIRSLMQVVEAGHRAAVVFVVQRDDCEAFATHAAADPAFGIAVQQGIAAGVEAVAYRCRVTEKKIELWDCLPMCSSVSAYGRQPSEAAYAGH